MVNKLKSAPIIYWAVLVVIVVLLSLMGVFVIRRSGRDSGSVTERVPLEVSAAMGTGGQTAMSTGGSGISILLSEGRSQPQAVATIPLATGEPLSEAEVEAILARLPATTEEPGDQVDFRLAQEPMPPPRTGDTVKEPFPPPPTGAPPEALPAGPLEVLRYSPEGEIPLAPFVSVTFNQPMVPLGTLSDLAAEAVPITIEPSLPGTWRWLGTKTLTFEYDSELIDRLPKATIFRVTVPAGTRSAAGGVLSRAVEWTFSTPPPKVTATYPQDTPQPVDPLIFIAFDQRIDPAAVLDTIQVRAGNQTVRMRLASDAEIQADEQVSRLVKRTLEGRWLVMRGQEPLPVDSAVSVVVGPGTPSAEGPLVTQEAQSFSFRTFAPLRIIDHGCSWSRDGCRPLTPFFIRFNNPIDPEVYQDSMLRIQPELPGASVNIFGDTLNIQGASRGQTTYTVVVDGKIQDIFGQTLGKDAELTFRVGSAEPILIGPKQIFVTLDPVSRKPVLAVYAMNYPRLDVQIYAVQPPDWSDYLNYLSKYQVTDQPPGLPGRRVLDKSLPIEAGADTLTEVGIDLSPYMDGDYGHFIVVVKPPKGLFQQQDYWKTVHVWVQVTQIGLDAFTDHSQMTLWATDLRNGAPLEGVTITAGKTGVQAVTGEDGVAQIPIPNRAGYLVAKKGADQALLPRSTYYWGEDAWNQYTVNDELRWYVFDDRQMYRPGEEVHVKGWLRLIGGKQGGDVNLVGDRISGVSYQVIDPQGNDLLNGRVDVNLLGGFDFVFTIPEKTNLGDARIYLTPQGNLGSLNNTDFYHSFQIQEFRRPEFEVSARNETPGPYFAGDEAVVAVEAKYYAGGALPNAQVKWLVSSSPASYSPPGWQDFTFGVWEPWWWRRPTMAEEMYWSGPGYDQSVYQTFGGFTDASGTHFLRLSFDQFEEPRPYTVLAEATVMDVNRQAWTDSTSLLVHPANLYVGMRSQKIFVQRGTPLTVDIIVTDLDGKPVTDRLVEVRAGRLESKYRGNVWREEEVDVQTCSVGSGVEPVTCTFDTPLGGAYRITATVRDELGRVNQSQFTRWVSGGQLAPSREVKLEEATLIPDKETYQPGDVAQILVQSPFTPAEGLLTVSRNGILYTRRFQIEEGSLTLDIPIEEQYIPNLNIQVDLVGAAQRVDDQGEPVKSAPKRPAFASAQLNLSIPPLKRTLDVALNLQEKELEPGGETVLDVLLKDADGQPVQEAELAVVVVDEAVLALSNYQMRDPLRVFYADRPSYLDSRYGRASIVLANPEELSDIASYSREFVKSVQAEAVMEAPLAAMPTMTPIMGPAAGAENAPAPIRLRSDFNPLAVFAPEVRTDSEGKARVPITLPDNLTRYRVMVVAVDQSGRRFGMAESSLVARLALMVRPSAPRFLNFGDQFELPVVLQNQTDDPLQVEVALRAQNIQLMGNNGMRVIVPARDRVEVRFPATTLKAGVARFQIAAVAGEYADAASVELPVYTPATSEAFAVYGVVDQGAIIQPVASPGDVFPQYGGLEINTSSTALQALTDAVLYLVSYPFECSEQLASRVLAIAALRDVLTAFNAEGLPSAQELEAAVGRDIERLQGLQNSDGGFPYWRRGQDSIPFNTIHVAHALQRAQLKGFVVPAGMSQSALGYLQKIESHYPAWYSQRTRRTLSAYALYVRSLMGDKDTAKALRLLEDAGLENLDLEAVGWLWAVLQDSPKAADKLDAIRRQVSNRVVETAGAANFTGEYDEQSYLLLSSDRRTDAILLDALMGDNPQHDLIPKLVNGLLAHRTRGRWANTQENVFVLLALDRYFNTFEAQTPDFVARIWLGEAYVGEVEFQGRSTERHETLVPMAYLLDESQGAGGGQNLIVGKEGKGRLYYRLGLRYAPTDLKLPPMDMGFSVQRSYEAIDNPEDVYQDADGVWHIKAGSRVRIRLTLVADNRRYHVALVDPLPAGLEIVNPELAVSGGIPQDPNSTDYYHGWWWGAWYEHQSLRDERAEAFTPLLWEGVYRYTYVARATTPGRFIVPPAKAEEMYSPEVFGRSSSDVVIVE